MADKGGERGERGDGREGGEGSSDVERGRTMLPRRDIFNERERWNEVGRERREGDGHSVANGNTSDHISFEPRAVSPFE